ncbi:MAG: hypothetical protein LBC51_06725 [Treponema sp.]|jgi:biotin operon repressor|nr:hypothetical protein [Treponema sp.]
MQEIVSLSELLEQYSQGALPKKDFEGRIFTFILENRRQFNLFTWNKDACVDFLCWFYPRMSRAITSYKDTGASFDAYIASLLYWSCREYRSQQADHDLTEYAFWEARAENMNPCETEPAYLEPQETIKPVSNPRQTLILLLKTYFFVSEERIARIAPAIGMEEAHLQHLIDAMRKRRLERDEARRGLMERVESQYYRCMVFRKKLETLMEGTRQYERIKGQMERATLRYTRMRNRLAAMHYYATNREVAEVLGISKGTVDSSLYAIKQKDTLVNPGKFPCDATPQTEQRQTRPRISNYDNII